MLVRAKIGEKVQNIVLNTEQSFTIRSSPLQREYK